VAGQCTRPINAFPANAHSVEETGAGRTEGSSLGAVPGTSQPDSRGAANPELLGVGPLTDSVLAKLFHFRHEFICGHWPPMRLPVLSGLRASLRSPLRGHFNIRRRGSPALNLRLRDLLEDLGPVSLNRPTDEAASSNRVTHELPKAIRAKAQSNLKLMASVSCLHQSKSSK
jgi:hypothetical protein